MSPIVQLAQDASSFSLARASAASEQCGAKTDNNKLLESPRRLFEIFGSRVSPRDAAGTTSQSLADTDSMGVVRSKQHRLERSLWMSTVLKLAARLPFICSCCALR